MFIKAAELRKNLPPADKNIGNMIVPIDLSKNYGWYDFTIKIDRRRYITREDMQAGWKQVSRVIPIHIWEEQFDIK